MSRTDYMIKAFRDIGISLSDKQVDQFNKYYSLLIEQNKVMNLTAITDYEEVVIKHFIDSLCLIRVTDLSEEKKIIDVGTGAGFPGIPLKIVYPNLRLVLLDSLNKRIKFLEDVISELGLNRNSILPFMEEQKILDKTNFIVKSLIYVFQSCCKFIYLIRILYSFC